jgi:Leucine-rich repeat (LRR) protein
LRFFKSDENIARLKMLLDDPDSGYLRHPVNNMGVEVRQYSVRKEAFETLEQWGVRVKKPIIRVETYRPEEVTIVSWSKKRLADGDLKRLVRFENLAILLLNDTNVTDASLKELTGLKKLRELRLSLTKVTDAGIKQLAELPNLQYLSVVHTKVTDNGVAELRKLRPDLKIEH